MGEGHEQRPRAAASLAVTTVVACGALLWTGAAAAGTDGDAMRIRLGADGWRDREFASLDEVEAVMDVDCPDIPSSAPPNGLVLCASVQLTSGEPRSVGGPGELNPLTEVLVAQGYCAVAPAAWDPDADDDELLDAEPPLPEGCLPSSVPLDLSGVSEEDRIMIEHLLNVPEPEFTIAP